MRIALIALFLVATGCARYETPPGYSGAYPSARGQAALRAIGGLEFTDDTGAFGGGDWRVGGFAVIPNYVTGKGPVVRLTRPGTNPPLSYHKPDPNARFVPVETDGDVADFYRRVTGRDHDEVSGATSEVYRAALIK